MPEYDPDQIATAYRAMFAARTDAYLDWDDHDPDPEQHHWFAVRKELTIERILTGLKLKEPISTYMEGADGTTHIGAIDFDREDGWKLGLAVAGTIRAAGGFPMLEQSRRGCHLWVVLSEVVLGDEVRLGLRHWIALTAPYAVRDPKVEILPKRLTSRGPETLGSPLRMPLMTHQRTGVRYPLCGPEGQPLGTSISRILLEVQETDASLLREAAASASVPAEEARAPSWVRRPVREGGDVVALLIAAGVDRAVPGRTVRCPIHGDRSASMSISKDAERVWCKSPACPAFNNGRGLGADQLAEVLGVNAQ